MTFIVGAIVAGGAALMGVGTATALTAGYVGANVMHGYQQGKKKEQEFKKGAAAAYDIYSEKLDLLGEKRDLTGQKIGLESDIAGAQFRAGQANIGMGANMALRRSQSFGQQAYSQANLATSGTIGQKVQTQEGDIRAKYKTDMTKLFESQQFAREQAGIATQQADIAEYGGQISAEEQYQRLLLGLDPGGGTQGAWDAFSSSIGFFK